MKQAHISYEAKPRGLHFVRFVAIGTFVTIGTFVAIGTFVVIETFVFPLRTHCEPIMNPFIMNPL
jgi:hypothetical protein